MLNLILILPLLYTALLTINIFLGVSNTSILISTTMLITMFNSILLCYVLMVCYEILKIISFKNIIKEYFFNKLRIQVLIYLLVCFSIFKLTFYIWFIILLVSFVSIIRTFNDFFIISGLSAYAFLIVMGLPLLKLSLSFTFLLLSFYNLREKKITINQTSNSYIAQLMRIKQTLNYHYNTDCVIGLYLHSINGLCIMHLFILSGDLLYLDYIIILYDIILINLFLLLVLDIVIYLYGNPYMNVHNVMFFFYGCMGCTVVSGVCFNILSFHTSSGVMPNFFYDYAISKVIQKRHFLGHWSNHPDGPKTLALALSLDVRPILQDVSSLKPDALPMFEDENIPKELIIRQDANYINSLRGCINMSETKKLCGLKTLALGKLATLKVVPFSQFLISSTNIDIPLFDPLEDRSDSPPLIIEDDL